MTMSDDRGLDGGLWGYYDRYDTPLAEKDLVRVSGISDELFRIKSFQFPADAIVENVLPGNRVSTSTIPCKQLDRAINNPVGKPFWWDDTYEAYEQTVALGSQRACGCYLRAGDLQAVLCEQHLLAVNGGENA